MAGVNVKLLCDLLVPAKTLKANFVQLFVFCGVASESSSFLNSILALPNLRLSLYRPYFDLNKKKAEFNVSFRADICPGVFADICPAKDTT